MRNTVRFLLGNLAGFDPARDAVPAERDGRARPLGAARAPQRCRRRSSTAYRNYEFHLIYQKMHNFCVVDLGGFYLDVLKDRLYTTPAKSARAPLGADRDVSASPRAMVRWLAPILSFTAEEIWRLHAGQARRVGVPRRPGTRCRRVAAQRPRSTGTRCSQLRSAVLRELEKLRVAGTIGAPLDAEVDVYCAPRACCETLQALGDELRFLLSPRGARAARRDAAGPAGGASAAERGRRRRAGSSCRPSTAPKCVRCWHQRAGCRLDRRASASCAAAAWTTSTVRASRGRFV